MTAQSHTTGAVWQPTWGQAMTDFCGEDEVAPFDNVTVRMTVPASIGGTRIRAEFSNRFGDTPVHVGRVAMTVGGVVADATFDGAIAVDIPAGESLWTDALDLLVRHGDELIVDLYLPDFTPYATANGFTFDRSTPGDFAGSNAFPLAGVAAGAEPDPDGTGWSLPAGGPFLRRIEVAGSGATAVVVCLGSSSTAMGWPQYAAALLPPEAGIAVINRGISGNRLLRDAPELTPSWGRAGLTRFADDVLDTDGASHVVIAYNTNDWTFPGRVTPADEMPTLEELVDGYREAARRAQNANLGVILATTTPLPPDLAEDSVREGIRLGLNDWIRASGHTVVDFDAALRRSDDPAHLDPRYAAPDNTHPNINGQKRLAQAMIEILQQQ